MRSVTQAAWSGALVTGEASLCRIGKSGQGDLSFKISHPSSVREGDMPASEDCPLRRGA